MVWSEVIPNEPERTWHVCPAWEGIYEQKKYYAPSQNYVESFHIRFLTKNISYNFTTGRRNTKHFDNPEKPA